MTRRDREWVLRWSDLAVLAVAVSFRPLAVFARNVEAFTHFERRIALIGFLWIAAVFITWMLVRLGTPRNPTVHSVFFVVALFMLGGRVLQSFGVGLGVTVVTALAVIAVVVSSRLAGSTALRVGVVGLASALIVSPVVVLVDELANYGGDNALRSEPLGVELTHDPDMFLVVLDGYPGLIALGQDSVLDPEALAAELRMAGFQVPSSAWSAYWSTELSVPSLLEMNYPVREGPINDATVSTLKSIVGGRNGLVGVLASNSYRTTMVESGWSLSACGSSYDICVPSSPFDEMSGIVLRDTLLGSWIDGTVGSAFTLNSVRTMDWLLENAANLSASPEPDFVFAHILAPHAPFYLNSLCETVTAPERSGYIFNLEGVAVSTRAQFFEEQLRCVNNFANKLAASIEDDDVIILVGDHGTDRRDHLRRGAGGWRREDVIERMNVMLAVRTGTDCSLPEQIILPNLMREVLSCHTHSRLEVLENRVWGTGMVELSTHPVFDAVAAG